MTRALALAFASTLLFACGDATDDGKGAEDNPLTNGKDDSFYRPTEHGELRFGISNPATMTEDAKFHAWTFTLTGEATVDVSTNVSQNLDTVMYLYHRTSPSDSWGRYVKKNDDDGDKISSRIELAADAGEYRVVVKGFKDALRGTFSVDGTCEGPGCVASDDTCDADTFETMPASSPFTMDCAYDLTGLLDGAPTAQSSGGVELGEKCTLTGVERTAIDFYHEYWSDFVDFEEQFGTGDPDEGIFLNFSKTKYAGGTEIEVDAGGDEDGLSMFFNNDGELLAAYQHNQSPTIDYYCTTGAPIEGPSEGCFSELMYALPHTEESARVEATVTAEEAVGVGGGLTVIAERFIDEVGISEADILTYEVITWGSTNGENVVEANMIFEDYSKQYTAWEDYDGWKIIVEVDVNGLAFVCE